MSAIALEILLPYAPNLSSSAGSAFAAKHAEAIFIAGHIPGTLAPKVAKIRQLAADLGRDPQS